MHLSLTRVFQWSVIALVLVALVGLNYDFDSKAGMRMNASLDDPLSQGLRGYWKLDEGTGTSTTADASGNANTLSMTGPPTWTTGTIGPYAMDFSGSGQYLSVASPASGVLDFANGASFSLTGWFNRDTFTADHTIVAKRNGQTATDDGYIVYIDDATDTLVFEASDTADTDEYQRVSTSAFTATGWHQFAVTWNDSATTDPVNIFIDGALSNGTATGTFANMGSLVESVAFRIGAESDAGVPFDGKIDDVRVYGYALSAGEVAKLYQTTAPTQPVDTGLVGHWTFDGPDIQGATAIDRSSFGNNGTITGTTKTIGKLGQGLSFNGTSENINIGTPNALSNLPQKTISAWIYPTNMSNYIGFIGRGTWAFQICSNDGTDCPGMTGALTYYHDFSGVDGKWRTGTGAITLNTWQQVVMAYDNSSASNDPVLYVNGTPFSLTEVTTPTGSATSESGGNLYVGFDVYVYFPGRIDDVRLYNRILSATEIADLYNMEK